MKTDVTLTIYMSEVIYDIQNKTYLTGGSRRSADNFEQVAAMQAGDDDDQLNQVLRTVGNAVANLRAKISEYMPSGTSPSTADDILIAADKDIVLHLSMPANYNTSANEAAATGIHQYIVNTAVGEWFNITDKADAAEYIQMANANLFIIREALGKRIRPERKAVG